MKKGSTKQFCLRNHDTFICGRDKLHRCIQCNYERNRIDPSKDSTIKQICINGHDTFITGRNANYNCILCLIEYGREYQLMHQEEIKQYRLDHIEEQKARDKQWYTEHKDEKLKYNRKWIKEHREEIREYQDIYNKRYYEENKIEIISKQKQYIKEHPEIRKLAALRAHAKRKLRIPKWGQEGIVEFYHNALKDMEVDHIIPLCGKKVSGLHVIWNLQYLTESENSKKSNKCNLLEAPEWYGKILEQAGLK